MLVRRITTNLAVTAAVVALGGLAAAHGQSPPEPPSAAVICGSKPATITGDSGANTIDGTPGDDVIAALEGNDLVRGLGGNDTICLGPGRDVVKGGAGDDTFISNATTDGSDNFVGDAGRDRVSYSARTVAVSVSIDAEADDGQPGERDKVQSSVEAITGSQAGDVLSGSGVDNAFDGGDGDDDLRGGPGNDSLRGNAGDDTIAGNAGDDFLFGNQGDDTALAASGADGADFFEGSIGIDTASYAARLTQVRVTLDNLANDGASGEGDDIRLDVENVLGGSGGDILRANQFQAEANRLVGNAGNDFLSVTDGPHLAGDVVDGGPHTDQCFGDGDDSGVNCEFSDF